MDNADNDFVSPQDDDINLSRQNRHDFIDEAGSRPLREKLEPSLDDFHINGKNTVDCQPSLNLEGGAPSIVMHRDDAIDPDAPLNSNEVGSFRFPEHYDRYVTRENTEGRAPTAAAENSACDVRDGVFATQFTMGETWPTQDDAHAQEDEGSLDFSLGKLDDSGTGSKYNLDAHEMIANHSNANCRDGSAPGMCNPPETRRDFASKTEENLLTNLSHVDAPRLPNGIPSFILAKVKKPEANDRKAQLPELHDSVFKESESKSQKKQFPRLNDAELATGAKVAPVNSRSFVDQIILSIFGADHMGVQSSNHAYFGENGIEWNWCGESTTIPIASKLLDPSSKDAVPGSADVIVPFKVASSEKCTSVVKSSDSHGDQAHKVAMNDAAKPLPGATPHVARHLDLIDTAVIVESPSDELDNGHENGQGLLHDCSADLGDRYMPTTAEENAHSHSLYQCNANLP